MRTISRTASKRDDHRVPGFAGLEKFDERNGIVGDDQALAQAVHHLRDRDGIVAQAELRDFFSAFENLLECFDQVHERDDQLALHFVAAVERFIGMRPDVGFDLLLLVEQLRGILEFFVFEQAVDELVARVRLVGGQQRVHWQQHFGFDVDQSGGHVDEIGGDVYIEFFELVQVVEILLGDFGDGDVVDVHLLLADEIKQQIERAFVRR